MKMLLGWIAAGALAATTVQADPVKDESFKDSSGARVLRESVDVAAPLDTVWAAFTTDDGFLKWSGVPVVHITPGNGGLIEFGLTPASRIGDPQNVRNRIILFMPDTLIAWQNEFVPDGGPFDPKAFASVRTIVTLDSADAGTTTVTETVIGFGEGAAFDQLYAHLHDGNAEYLTMLANSFQTKP